MNNSKTNRIPQDIIDLCNQMNKENLTREVFEEHFQFKASHTTADELYKSIKDAFVNKVDEAIQAPTQLQAALRAEADALGKIAKQLAQQIYFDKIKELHTEYEELVKSF